VCHVLLITLVLAACGGAEKEATEAAINAAQIAIDSASSVAAEYVPDQLESRGYSAKGENRSSKGRLRHCNGSSEGHSRQVSEMAKAAVKKKEELAEGWRSLIESMSKSLRQLKAKLDAFSHGAKLPFGMDRWQLADAKEQYQQLIQAWALATAAAQQGNLGYAITLPASGIYWKS
jgi:hypothetical protein